MRRPGLHLASEQTFLSLLPLRGAGRAGSSSLLFFSSAAQVFGWVGAGFFTCLSIHHLHLFSYYAWDAWIPLQPFSSCASPFLPCFTKLPSTAPKGWTSPPRSHLPFHPVLELSQWEIGQDPTTPIHGSIIHVGRQSRGHRHRDCKGTAFPRDFHGAGIILPLLWREEYSLSGGVASDWDLEVAN